MKQFLLPRSYAGEARVSLFGADHRYLARVLRLREGAELAAVDARGSRYLMKIVRVGSSTSEVEITAAGPAEQPAGAPALTLLQCLPKGRKIDLIIRQATEAGVSRIIPLFSERSQVRSSEDSGRQARLERIAREALQQSGNARLPAVEQPRPFAALADEPDAWGTAIFFHEEKLSGSGLHELLAEPSDCVSILIGPEGGLSPSEIRLLTRLGFRPAFLGGAVLRVETAAIYALGAVRTIVQERDSWRANRKS